MESIGNVSNYALQAFGSRPTGRWDVFGAHRQPQRRLDTILSPEKRTQVRTGVHIFWPLLHIAPNKVGLTFALIPAFSPEEKENRRPMA